MLHCSINCSKQRNNRYQKEQTMPNTSKSSKKASPVNGAASVTEFVDAFTPLYLNGVERMAELQKNALDLAAEPTSEWMDAWKKAFSFLPVTPPTAIFEIAGQAVQTYVKTHKSAIDLAVEQSHAVAKIGQERADAYSKIAGEATTAFRTSVERSVEAQKKVLEFAAQQNKVICETTRKQLAPLGGPALQVVDTFQQGAETLIEAQKSFLDATTKSFAIAAKG
jgi:hypothetical protein